MNLADFIPTKLQFLRQTLEEFSRGHIEVMGNKSTNFCNFAAKTGCQKDYYQSLKNWLSHFSKTGCQIYQKPVVTKSHFRLDNRFQTRLLLKKTRLLLVSNTVTFEKNTVVVRLKHGYF